MAKVYGRIIRASDDESVDIPTVSVYLHRPFDGFTMEFQRMLDDAKRRAKSKSKTQRLYRVNQENKVETQIPIVIDDWDLLDQIYRLTNQNKNTQAILQSRHTLAMFIRTIRDFAGLALLEKLIVQLEHINFANLYDLDAKIFLLKIKENLPGFIYPYAQGFTVNDWDIVENSDGSNLFIGHRQIQIFSSTVGNEQCPDFILNLELEIQGLDADTKTGMKMIQYENGCLEKKYVQFDQNNVCKLNPFLWRKWPLRSTALFVLGIVMPKGKFPQNSIHVVCRHQRVMLHAVCSKELDKLMKSLSVVKTSSSLEMKFKSSRDMIQKAAVIDSDDEKEEMFSIHSDE